MKAVQSLSTIALVSVIILAAALLNGYPLVFYDTGDYIAMSEVFTPLIYRTFPYSLFLRATHMNLSLWGPVIAQALLTAWTLWEFITAFGAPRGKVPATIIAALLLCLATPLPWVAGQLMPDALAAPMVLALCILIFERTRLSPLRRGLLILPVIAGAMAHLSQLALALGLIGFAAMIRLTAHWLHLSIAPRLGLAAAAVLTALIAIPSMNYALTGRLFYSEAGSVFLTARLAQDGLLQAQLARACPEAGYALCGFQTQIRPKANDFLWLRESPLVALGGWYGFREEAGRIVKDSLIADPAGHLKAAVDNSGAQFFHFASGEGLFNQWEQTRDTVERYFPNELAAYDQSLQRREKLDFTQINRPQRPFALAAVAFCLGAGIWYGWRRDWPRAGLHGFIIAMLAGNAMICGILSNPTDRYQARVVWLAAALALTEISRWRLADRADQGYNSSIKI